MNGVKSPLIVGNQTFVCWQVACFAHLNYHLLFLCCKFNSLFAQEGSMCPSGGPVHSHTLLHNSRIMVHPTFVVGQKNFVAHFPSQFGHGCERAPSFGVPDQWLFEVGLAMLGEDNNPMWKVPVKVSDASFLRQSIAQPKFYLSLPQVHICSLIPLKPIPSHQILDFHLIESAIPDSKATKSRGYTSRAAEGVLFLTSEVKQAANLLICLHLSMAGLFNLR